MLLHIACLGPLQDRVRGRSLRANGKTVACIILDLSTVAFLEQAWHSVNDTSDVHRKYLGLGSRTTL